MAKFEPAITLTLQHEGGYVNDPKDRGGETKFGISKRSYPSLNISSLTVETASEIYKRDYWRFDQIQDQALANKVFDMSVLCSPKNAVRMLQSSVCACGHVIPIDGMWGLQTISAANAIPPDELLATFKQEVSLYFKRIVANNPVQDRFLRGWLERVES